ncbi:hypothetical protein EJ110_NYTH01258 [Nymphaea thermarum]|nr:hypothetical protein EJ110_NYTH01258 [Nymphaea thermarum]
MEKCRSFPEYSSFSASFGYENRSNSYSFNGPDNKDQFSAPGDPEMKRKRRVASYKAYAVEGKIKSSVKSSLRWIKGKYSEIRYGF